MDINSFYNTFDKFVPTSTDNPLDYSEKCILINNRKAKYYNYKYQPSLIINDLYSKFSDNSYLEEYIYHLTHIFNTTDDIVTNRCNCISLVLYINLTLGEKLGNKPLSFLYSIQKTIRNVATELPKWLVRIYFDPTIYDYILTVTDEYSRKTLQILEYILKADNVEVYTYQCKSFEDPNYKNNKKRSLRYLPLIDMIEYNNNIAYGTNLVIIREADGIVSNLDCRNIMAFENSQRVFSLSNIGQLNDHIKYPYLYDSYSAPLTYYKVMNKGFYGYRNNIFDLLAGTIGLSLKIRKEYYNFIVENTKNMISLDHLSDADISDFDTYQIIFKKKIALMRINEIFDYFSYDKDDLIKIMDITFDEILLLELFKELISPHLSDIKHESILDTWYINYPEYLEFIKKYNPNPIIEVLTYQQDHLDIISYEILDNKYNNPLIYQTYNSTQDISEYLNIIDEMKFLTDFNKNKVKSLTIDLLFKRKYKNILGVKYPSDVEFNSSTGKIRLSRLINEPYIFSSISYEDIIDTSREINKFLSYVESSLDSDLLNPSIK